MIIHQSRWEKFVAKFLVAEKIIGTISIVLVLLAIFAFIIQFIGAYN